MTFLWSQEADEEVERYLRFVGELTLSTLTKDGKTQKETDALLKSASADLKKVFAATDVRKVSSGMAVALLTCHYMSEAIVMPCIGIRHETMESRYA